MKEAIIQYNDTPSSGHLAISWKPLVRGKDCKWYSEKGFCKHPNGGAGNVRPDNWFCADGEKR